MPSVNAALLSQIQSAFWMSGSLEDPRSLRRLTEGVEGDVVVTQGNRTLRAPRVEMDHISREGAIPSEVQIEEPTAILRGRNAALNLDSKATVIEDAEFRRYVAVLGVGLPLPVFRVSPVAGPLVVGRTS